MNNIYHKIITGGFALVLAGAVAFTAAPMDAQASAALGISSQIGLSADMDAAETTDVENAIRPFWMPFTWTDTAIWES